MSVRRRPKVRTGFRPSQVFQHRARTVEPSAREMFAIGRQLLLASRPVLEVVNHRYLKDAKGKPVKVTVYGPPTFRNVIEDGELK